MPLLDFSSAPSFFRISRPPASLAGADFRAVFFLMPPLWPALKVFSLSLTLFISSDCSAIASRMALCSSIKSAYMSLSSSNCCAFFTSSGSGGPCGAPPLYPPTSTEGSSPTSMYGFMLPSPLSPPGALSA
eukprot:CAMPEP_0197571394 /NCGR_PEP_ID=MMETSP1320-20131121/41936_1 /TAXON_ID=91990 /ORGANISM="Bolidomonas sp., Strain RCC2347" /LENGTH=130 /DNA_ID=CAMNT_0043133887 /DNA_START=620 /DNA_END=1012 /DNA_ORIENTATION=+